MFTQWLTRTSLRVRRISRLHNISSLRHASPNRAFSPMCNFFSKKIYIYYYLLMHRSNVGETLSPPSHTPCPRNNVMVLLLLLHCTLRYTTHKPPRRPPPQTPTPLEIFQPPKHRRRYTRSYPACPASALSRARASSHARLRFDTFRRNSASPATAWRHCLLCHGRVSHVYAFLKYIYIYVKRARTFRNKKRASCCCVLTDSLPEMCLALFFWCFVVVCVCVCVCV